MREWIKKLLYRRPVYYNGLDMYLILEAQDEIRAAQERGELTEDDAAFVLYIQGIMRASFSFILMILVLLFVTVPILSRTENTAVMVVVAFLDFFLTLFLPNRILHHTLKVRFADAKSPIAVVRLIAKIGYGISWAFLSVLFLLVIIFVVMLVTTLA